MAPYDEEFTRLKAGDETRKIARSLYLQSSELTKPGSGRGLGLGRSALSAVCAFLASRRLGNGEVTREQACAVACVDPKTFDSTLAMVENILRPSRSSPRRIQTNITYRSLLKQFVSREDAYVPMLEVEELLRGREALVDGSPVDLESSLMQCAIFYWVCTAVLKVTVPDATHFRQMLKVSPKAWSASQRVLESRCSHMREDLVRKAETALSARATRSQMRTPTKEKNQASLRNLVAPPGKPSVPLTPPKSPLVHGVKRKMSAEVECRENGSPLKRSRGPGYVPSGLGEDLSTHTPKARRVNAAASLPTPPHEEEESEDEASNETIVVRPARLSRKKLDRSAWDLQKPTTATARGEPLTPSPSYQGSPGVGVVAFDNTPTTRISGTCSPATPTHSRAVGRTRLHVPLVAKAYSYPSSQEEEMPRRRRRNLRAAFLNPGVYGWAQTAKKLERARNWESLMIAKYGDPWDAL